MIESLLLAASILTTVPDLSPDVPSSYEITAYLDDSSHTVTGSMNIEFMNPTSRELDTIAFHLYPNAFKHSGTVYCSEDEYAKRSVEKGNVSKIEVNYMTINEKAVEPGEYKITGTLLYIPLKKPLKPGASIFINLEFETLIPKMIGHFGYDSDGDYLVAHCLPILCGYQKGRMIDAEYHSTSEFFSNFSHYAVTLELPRDFKVASSGVLTKESENDSTAIWQAFADTVIDFAFVCGAGFSEYDSVFDDVSIKYLVKKRHEDYFPAIDSTVKTSLRFCDDYLYPYPYKNFSFVDAGFSDAGLELPGMVIASIYGRGKESSTIYLKETIAHEVAHQWFYATIATNESKEPWLDEGFATFMEVEIARKFGFEGHSLFFPDYVIPETVPMRFFSHLNKGKYSISVRSWDYPDQQSYYTTVYGKSYMVLQALESVLGDSIFAKSIKSYAEKYKYKHPDKSDLLKCFAESSSRDISRFTDMFIDGTARVDYSVESLSYKKKKAENDSVETKYAVKVELARNLDGILPQVVTIGLEDGSVLEQSWDGIDREKQIEFETESIPVYASIDKRISYELDENMNNNTFYMESHITRMISFEWDTIFIIEFLASIFL